MSIKEILQLPVAERIELAERIWDSLKSEDIAITLAQREELDSRIAIDKAGKMLWYSLDEVKARLDKRS